MTDLLTINGFLQALRERGYAYRATDSCDHWIAVCPACEDRTAWTLVIFEPDPSFLPAPPTVRLKCQNGCAIGEMTNQLEIPAPAVERIRRLRTALDQAVLIATGIDLIASHALAQWERLEHENASLRRRLTHAKPHAGAPARRA